MEAVDLGVAMTRTWWPTAIAAWLPLFALATCVATLVFHDNHGLAIIAIWWLKPLFDRAVLDVLARAVFGERPRLREVIGAALRSPGLLASLTVYRFDLARSFNLPVWHLERLRGRAATRRARALHGRSRRHAVWATIVFLHFELLVMLSLWAAIDLFTPAPYDQDFGLMGLMRGEAAPWQQWLSIAFYAATVTLLEPFYVAAGFALYLNRRTELEAWDVELALRRYGRRERARPRAAVVAAALVLALVLPPIVAPEAQAAEREASSAIREILASPEFEQYQDVRRLRYIGGSSDRPPESGARASWQGLGAFAELARVAMWIVVIAALLYALYRMRHLAFGWSGAARPRYTPPGAVFGLEIAPESLPRDVAAAALAQLNGGHTRLALSLLYRGALSALVHRGGLEIAAGDTEGDCVRRVAALGDPGRSDFFGRLVAHWQETAYAGRLPEADSVAALCAEWRRHFAEAAAA